MIKMGLATLIFLSKTHDWLYSSHQSVNEISVHTTWISVTTIRSGGGSNRSSSLKPLIFFLWSTVKDEMYSRKPRKAQFEKRFKQCVQKSYWMHWCEERNQLWLCFSQNFIGRQINFLGCSKCVYIFLSYPLYNIQ